MSSASSTYLIILEPRKMLKRKDLPPPEQSASVIDQLVVESLEHVYINIGKLQFKQLF